ncbi:hypothetical protein [Microcoleus sp. B4-C1]|uniref:hypothetical protein n=1 Tax=Microcoleus sp. B4-C1 TaxID=2818660 RepID=UPI002FD66616
MGELISLNPNNNTGTIPDEIARDSEFQAADAAHVEHPNPHDQYLTQSEADARYLGTGGGTGIAATISISAIEGALRSRFRSNFFIESHYLATAGNGNFPASFSNGGFGFIRAEVDRPGILNLSTGSNSNGFAVSSTGMGNNASGIILDDGPITYVGIIKIPVLRDVTNDFVVEVGFQSSGSTIGIDACCFVYDASSANWQCHTRTNGDLAIIITATPVVANQWLELQIAVSNGIAIFTINGIQVLSTSQKLPLSPRMVGAGIDIRKTTGTSGRDTWIDYQSVEQIFDQSANAIIEVQGRALTDEDIPATIARDTEVDSKIASAILASTGVFWGSWNFLEMLVENANLKIRRSGTLLQIQGEIYITIPPDTFYVTLANIPQEFYTLRPKTFPVSAYPYSGNPVYATFGLIVYGVSQIGLDQPQIAAGIPTRYDIDQVLAID